MEIYADKENESRDGQQSLKQSLHVRTPLLDVKNKCAKTNLLPTEFSQKLDALNLHTLGTPGRKQSKVSRRMRSCIPAFQPQFSEYLSGTEKILTRTLPLMMEEEPDEPLSLELIRNSGNTITFVEIHKENDETSDLTEARSPSKTWDENISNVEVEITEDAANGQHAGTDVDVGCEGVQSQLVRSPVHPHIESHTASSAETHEQENEESSLLIEAMSPSKTEDEDIVSVEVEITEDTANEQDASIEVDVGCEGIQSSRVLDDSGTTDCAEVSSSALPSEQELNCSLTRDLITSLVETMFPRFEGNITDVENVELVADHTYSVCRGLDVEEIHLNELHCEPACINIFSAEETLVPNDHEVHITIPSDQMDLAEQFVDFQLVNSPVHSHNESYTTTLAETHGKENEESSNLTEARSPSKTGEGDIVSVEVEITEDTANEQDASIEVDVGCEGIQSSRVLDDSGTTDCAEVSYLALPSEHELHCSLTRDSITSLVETMFPGFEGNIEGVENVELVADHTYSLCGEIDVEEIHLNELHCGPACINIFTTEETLVPTDHQVHITIPSDEMDLAEQFVDSQLVNSPVHPHNESYACLDMNRVESELMQLMVDSMTAGPLSTELSDSTVHHLLGVDWSPFAGRGDLNSGDVTPLTLPSFVFEPNEQVDILSDVSVRFTPVSRVLHRAGSCDAEESPAVPAGSFVTNYCLHRNVISDQSFLKDEADINNQSVMAVPSVTETSMNTDTCLGLDISQNTDSVTTLDHSMMAIPDIVNKQTMTERKLLKDAESSMTPFKPAKMGKRLTTEDVRRQHPRTIANQLEATISANHRLEREVKLSLHEKDQLKAALKETQTKLIGTEKQWETEKFNQEKHIKMLEELHEEATTGLQKYLEEKQSTIYNLEQELMFLQRKFEEDKIKAAETEAQNQSRLLESAALKAKQDFEEELQRLKNRYNESNYKRQFQASLQAIEELRSERDELLGLSGDIESAFTQQMKYKDALDRLAHKVQTCALLQMEEYNRLVSELKESQTKCCDTQKENKRLNFELEDRNSMLNKNQNLFAEMESIYMKDREELAESKKLIFQYTEELEETTEALDEATQAIEALTQQLDEVRTSEMAAGQALHAAEERVKVLEQELMETKQTLDVTSQSKSKKEKEYEATISKLEKYITDLQQTLDAWEADRERDEQELYECREQMLADKMKLDEMTSEVEALRTIKATTQADKAMITELKTTIRLLEEEKQLCIESISDYRNKLEDEVELNSSNQQLIEALRRSNTNLQESYNQLMSEMQLVEAYLSLRNSDLDSSGACLQNLEERMNTLMFRLQQKLGQEMKCESAKKRQKLPQGSVNAGDSFVALVLARASQALAVSSPDRLNGSQASLAHATGPSCSTHKRRQTNVLHCNLHPDRAGPLCTESVSLGNQKCPFLDMSGLELFSPTQKNPARESAKKSAPQDALQDSCCSLVPGFASIRSIPSTSVRALVSKSDSPSRAPGRQSQTNVSSEYQPLLIKVQDVERLFDQIEKSFSMVEKAADLTIDDLKFDLEMMSKKVQNVSVRESRLESELTKKIQMLNNSNDKMKEMNAQIIGMNENLLKFQDQAIEISKLNDDKAELKHKVQDLKGQVALLSEQLAEVIRKLGSGSRKDGDSAQEILQLKKMNHELTMKLLSERDKYKELGEKAMKRMKILESNWKKAENEVGRFDELVEQIRQACINSQCQSTVPVVLHIVRLIDGIANYQVQA